MTSKADAPSLCIVNEPILDYVRRRLDEEYRGQWSLISKDSGVPYDTIAKIVQGRRENPGVKTLQPILDWMNARDEMLSKLRGEEKAA